MSEQLEYAVEIKSPTILGPAVWRLVTGWHRDKLTAMAHVGHSHSHRTLRLVARRPASDHWAVEA